MTIWHAGMEQRLATFPRHQQLFIVANELNRAHHQRANPLEYKNALERTLELLDYHIQSLTQPNQLKEILRLRDIIAEYYLNAARGQGTQSIQKVLVQLDPTAWKQIGKSFGMGNGREQG